VIPTAAVASSLEVLSVLLAISLSVPLLSPTTARAAVPSAALKDDWVEVRSGNFIVFGNSGAADASDVARRLERLREVLSATNPTLDASVPVPIRVYAFRSEGSFKSYRPGSSENLSGFNSTAEDGDMIAYDAGLDASEGIGILYHEYIHSYLRHNFVRLPAWLNEGMAEYYCTFSAGPSSAEIARTVPRRLLALKGLRLMPLEQLFAVTYDSPDFRSREGMALFYAESWALTHFLSQRSPDDTRRFQRFLARVRRGNPPLEAFTEVAPRERWGALLRELEDYCGNTRFNFWQYTFKERFVDAETRARTMTRAEVLHRLGELATRLGDPTGHLAEEHFRLSLLEDSLQAHAAASLGYLLDRRGDTMRAESLYAAAAAMAPDDPEPYVVAGRGSLRRHQHNAGKPTAGAARGRFARAIELDSRQIEALIGYGRTFVGESEPAPLAVSALRGASALLPARVDVACDLAILLARTGRCTQADSVLREKIEPLGEPELARSIRRTVFNCRLDQAAKLDGAGLHADAQRALREAISSTDDPALKTLAQARLDGSLRGEGPPRPGRVPGPLVVQQSPEAYAAFQRGLQAANQQRYAEAIRELEQARDLAGDSPFRETVTELLTSVQTRARLVESISLINAGQLARARSLLDDIARGPLDDSTRAYVTRLIRRTDTRIALDRGVKRAVRNDLKAAGGLFDSVLASQMDDDLRGYARSLDRQVDSRLETREGIELLRAGSLREARARFEALQKTPMSATMRSHVAALIAHTDGRLAVERAIELAKAGQADEARKLLTAVLEMPVGASLRAYVESLIRQLAPAR
jgi:tetratricopeptide (TPR) repeat protein